MYFSSPNCSYIIAAELTASGTPCYDIPMGGASNVGSIGFASGFVELAEQMDAMGLTADYVYHATGTGGTMAGLHAGRKLVGSQAEIRSITVSPKNDAYLTKVQNLANQDTVRFLIKLRHCSQFGAAIHAYTVSKVRDQRSQHDVLPVLKRKFCPIFIGVEAEAYHVFRHGK